MTSATIRPMTIDDAAAVAALNGDLGYPTTTPEASERIATLAASDSHVALVAEVDGRVVGWVHVARKPSLVEAATVQVMGLVVGDGHRSRGIGLRLLVEAEAWAARAGARRIVVGSRVTRERAHRFYLRHGYALHKTSHWFEKRVTKGA